MTNLDTWHSKPFRDIGHLLIYSPKNVQIFIEIRQAFHVSAHPAFDNVIMVVIICNCVTMGLDSSFIHAENGVDPRNNKSLVLLLGTFDVVFTLIFTGESAIKSLAWSFCHGPDSYLRSNAWNKLDFAIVVVSWVDYLASAADIGYCPGPPGAFGRP